MKRILQLEEVGMLLLALFLFQQQSPYSWWLFAACILLPDLSMLGYLGGNKAGAFLYNLLHHKGIAILVYLAGNYLESDPLLFAGLILFAHASMDRIFGYGLKQLTGFHDTHLGKIGKAKTE
ncbi:DUF4260 domain-containing protein [Chitinophaga pendula]|nr:hypothetical protein CK934_19905 [Chitinophaga sp. MD30]UCJ10235.1 DUF4260 domain-containing protein [Chitinophaga pendula]